jgi:hypothetical protein
MPTRYFSRGQSNQLQPPLPTGYEVGSGPHDLYIPPVGLTDVDRALFNLFKDEISPVVADKGPGAEKKVPIIFASAEKWAMFKKQRGVRDRNDSLIIPLITIVRTDVSQDISSDVTGRGINQQTGELVVRRKLDKSDRGYQALINRFLLRNQPNVAVPSVQSTQESLATERQVGDLADPSYDRQGGPYLESNITNNIVETIVVPSPQFYTVKYEVTIWTQFIQHSNQIIEKIVSSYLPQGQCWRLDTPAGYWFVASVDGGAFASENNFDDMSQQEKFIKHTFSVVVPAYFFIPRLPGTPIPVKRYVSSPTITFDVDPSSENELEVTCADPTDTSDPTLPMTSLLSPRKIKVVASRKTCETVFTGAQLQGLEIVIVGK